MSDRPEEAGTARFVYLSRLRGLGPRRADQRLPPALDPGVDTRSVAGEGTPPAPPEARRSTPPYSPHPRLRGLGPRSACVRWHRLATCRRRRDLSRFGGRRAASPWRGRPGRMQCPGRSIPHRIGGPEDGPPVADTGGTERGACAQPPRQPIQLPSHRRTVHRVFVAVLVFHHGWRAVRQRWLTFRQRRHTHGRCRHTFRHGRHTVRRCRRALRHGRQAWPH